MLHRRHKVFAVKNRQAASRPFRFWGMGKIRLGLIFIAFVSISSVVALLAISAFSTHFAYASAKTVPIPPKRPDVMSASPAYIRQLMATRKGYSDVYDDAFSYDSGFVSAEEEYTMVSLQEIEPQLLSDTLNNENIRLSLIHI